MNVIPGKQYKKYIKLFTGIILILIILSPVSQLFKLEETLSYYLSMENYQLELEQVPYDLILADEKHLEEQAEILFQVIEYALEQKSQKGGSHE